MPHRARHVTTPKGEHAELVPLVGGYLHVGATGPHLVGDAEVLQCYQHADEQRQACRRELERRANERRGKDRREKRPVPGRRVAERRAHHRRVVWGRRWQDSLTVAELLDIAVVNRRLRTHVKRRTPPNGVRL